jgi:hypothetical protein
MSQIKLSTNASGTGIFTIDSPNSNTNRTLTLPDATGTIITTAGGAAISGTTGTFTGLVDISAAGAGQIKFPATQNASSDANTLDDYEEGTWTPTITSDGGTITSSTFTNGLYTKIGRIVCVSGLVTLTNVGTASGNLQLTLPIASANDNWGGAGAEILAAGYQVAVCGSGGKLIIRKYDWSSLWTNNHGFRFTAVYPT